MRQVVLLVALCISSTLWAESLPAVQFFQNTAYICGGIGSDQAKAFKSARSHYPLSLHFAQKQGDKAASAADVQVVIRDQQGQTVLNINSDGPYCLLDIDYDSYQVYATYAGQTQQKSLTLTQQGQELNFIWPELISTTR